MNGRSLRMVLLALWLTACSVELRESPPTSLPLSITPIASAPAASPTPALGLPSSTSISSESLILTLGPQGIARLDLTTSTFTSIFQPPKNSWVSGVTLAPGATRPLVMAFTPPPPEGQPQLGQSGLYELEAGSARPLLESKDEISYFAPQWSADGRFIYYVRNQPVRGVDGAISYYKNQIERWAYPAGPSELIVDDALWPRLSPDGAHLAYAAINPHNSFEAQIVLADLDGANPLTLVPKDVFFTVDAPLFSPDGATVFFSAVGDGPTTWLDNLLGLTPAFAAPPTHTMPGDWWSVPTGGGSLTRLTRLYEPGLYAEAAPDGERLFFISAAGLYSMKPDGSDVRLLLAMTELGMVVWEP